MEINTDWAENAFVVKANILHENVHDGRHKYKGSNKIELSSVAVYNDELDLYGITDCIEFVKSESGVKIDALDGRYMVNIIEYKPKQPSDGTIRETDAIQVYAQKLCADYIWGCNSDCYIYYSDTRKRIKLPFAEDKEKYDSLLKRLLSEMKHITETGVIPNRKKGQKCSGCSIQDLCFPQNKAFNVRRMIKEDA